MGKVGPPKCLHSLYINRQIFLANLEKKEFNHIYIWKKRFLFTADHLCFITQLYRKIPVLLHTRNKNLYSLKPVTGVWTYVCTELTLLQSLLKASNWLHNRHILTIFIFKAMDWRHFQGRLSQLLLSPSEKGTNLEERICSHWSLPFSSGPLLKKEIGVQERKQEVTNVAPPLVKTWLKNYQIIRYL